MPASPRLLSDAPSRTSAICPRRMLDPSASALTTVMARSSALSTRARLRINRSLCASGRKPPEELTFDSSMADCTSCKVTPAATSNAGSTSTWYCRTSPPITVICDTPGILIRRRRMSQSARVRSSIGLTDGFSLVRPMAIIWPMIEETGPRNGRISCGNRGVTSATFSPTICRARYVSVSQPNSTKTNDNPMPDIDRTRSTPAAPLTAVSSGTVTSISTSSGANPPASVKMVTVGRLRSGNTSTGIRVST